MDTPRKTTSANDPESDRARRVEKEWRHEDFELTATYNVCRLVVAVQAAFIPVSGVMVGRNPSLCLKSLFVLILILSLCSIASAIAVPIMLSDYHRYSSWYYGITGSGTTYPDNFDEEKNEKTRKGKRERFNYWSPKLFWFVVVSFVASSILFCVIIISRRTRTLATLLFELLLSCPLCCRFVPSLP